MEGIARIFHHLSTVIAVHPAPLNRLAENGGEKCGLALIRLPLLILLLLAAAVGLSGCSQPDDNALRFGLSSAPINLDPRFATDATSTRINRLLYQRLVDFDQNLRPRPSLAEWHQLDPLHFRFHLLISSATFSDGTVLNARDIKATYDSVLDPATGSPHRAGLNMIDAIKVIDEQTVDFLLNKHDPLFPGRLVIGIMPAKLLASKHAFSRSPVGSGPFEFVSWPEDGKLVLKRLDDGRHLEFITVKNPTVRVLKLLRGEIDMLQNDLPPELVNYLAGQDNILLQKGPGTRFTYLGFNLQDAETGKLKLRQAIAYAIDRQAIIKYLMGDAATPASALLPPDHWAGNPKLKLVPYDPDKARLLLKEAGYTAGKRPHLVYKTSSDPFRIRLATVIQQQLADVGIDVELRSYDWGTFYGDIKAGRFQMFSLSWVGIKTPDIFRYVFHSESVPPNGANRGRYFDKVADALIEKAEKELVLADQADVYAELQARLLAQLPYVPLWYEDNLFAARKEIKGYTLARDGNYDGLIHVTKD